MIYSTEVLGMQYKDIKLAPLLTEKQIKPVLELEGTEFNIQYPNGVQVQNVIRSSRKTNSKYRLGRTIHNEHMKGIHVKDGVPISILVGTTSAYHLDSLNMRVEGNEGLYAHDRTSHGVFVPIEDEVILHGYARLEGNETGIYCAAVASRSKENLAMDNALLGKVSYDSIRHIIYLGADKGVMWVSGYIRLTRKIKVTTQDQISHYLYYVTHSLS